jgi:sugar phosphate permease
MSKEQVRDELGFSTTAIGAFDTVYLFFYALGNFVSGHLGDIYPVRVVVPVGMAVAAVCYAGVTPTQLAFLGLSGANSFAGFVCLWAVLGFAQAGVWPGGIAVVSNWFPAKVRGTVMGLWAPSSAVGNIIGEQIASLYFDGIGLKWEHATLTYACLMLLSAGLFAAFISQKPPDHLLPQDVRGQD